ncbi:unnamed protein product [Haemonchus placei]|uniref:TPX2 domain-containing protein n=1 Tax=Haemonchus placei TaxID=6290 RepID=A0A0N4VY69_HAEPC|nr:unnamed protein product [Haemonchus placei]
MLSFFQEERQRRIEEEWKKHEAEHPVDEERQRAEQDMNERAHLQSQTKRRSAGPAPGAVPIMPGIAQPVTPKERPQPREELPVSVFSHFQNLFSFLVIIIV